MTVKITSPVKGGRIRAIPSKSAAHRLLLCAALADGETFVACPESSEDIDATVRCLQALGAAVKHENGGFQVTPFNREKTATRVLNCGESGSTLRFLLPVCGALGINTVFGMSGRLPARPLTGLYEEMAAHGCTLSPQGVSPLTCSGKLTGGDYVIPGGVSSQFITGLLFALPLIEGSSRVSVTGELESRPYVDMTLDALDTFGITITEMDNKGVHQFIIKGGQQYRSPKVATAEGDWSNSAFWLCAGAIGESGVTVSGLNTKSRQGDRAAVDLLKQFGAKVSCKNDTVSVSPGILRGITIDAANIPDLVPVLAVVAAAAEGKTVITNAARLRLKESDRLKTVTHMLTSLGADVSETSDGLVINGDAAFRRRHGEGRLKAALPTAELNGGETQSFGDHRIAMAAAIASAICSAPVVIKDADAVNKSYPAFFNDFAALGGELS